MTADLASGDGTAAEASQKPPLPPSRRPAWFRRPVTVPLLLVLTLLVCLLGYAAKAPCRDTRNWSGDFQYTHLCYSDVVALYGTDGLSSGQRPYLDSPVEYPVLLGAAMQLGAEVSRLAPVTRPSEEDLSTAVFFDATVLLLTLAAGVVVACTALAAGVRRRDALLVAVAPTLLVHAFTNWDLLAVAFAAAGLAAWARRAPRLAGLLLGVGAATKLYPLLLLVPLGLLCLRAGRLRTWLRTLGFAVGTLVLVNLPVYLFAGYFTADGTARGPAVLDVLRAGDGLGAALAPHHQLGGLVTRNALLRFLDLNKERVADWDSLAFALQYVASAFSPQAFAPVHLVVLAVVLVGTAVGVWRLRRRRVARLAVAAAGLVLTVLVGWGAPRVLGYTRRVATLPVAGVNLVTGVAFLLLLGGIALLVVRAPRRPRVAQVAFLTVVAFLLTNKVFSPQYVLWVVPLAALARPRWRSFLAWQATELLVLVTRYYFFANAATHGATGIGLGWFVGAVVLRDLALAALAVLVVRDVLHPERDVVRADGVDDPAGGILEDAGRVPLRPA